MSRQEIQQLIDDRVTGDGLVDTGVPGVQLFRVTEAVRCTPAVYEPTLVAIVSGKKEAIIDGESHVYDSSRYLCCAISLPVEAGTPMASPDDPLLGVQITLDPKVMTELAIEMENAAGAIREPRGGPIPQGFALAHWDDAFTDALLRLIQLGDDPTDTAVLGASRLREVYYAVLKGEAGATARRAFGVGNEIARVIEHVSTHLDESITIDDMAAHVGMSRAVFHRKFKQATTMSPIQFVKGIRLNNAAMRMASGMTVNEAATHVGYASSSQFSREFKRMYGQSPKQWSQTKQPLPAGLI
ncbi:AraC family transcriptional regulator [Ilumatobacter coccineus]|uniref:Putative AraC family transcriptional regulator n=1 Tax=Ilumatobacter coccineus (strain NBRC 103263 / KCTC 29153 / YM16-304) TaxID=1313172 RepID=A0A6C7E1W2_ILUCY|nr:AraC family transcriptional regulator [Ilumatobacter coccineus]BAN00843.1 putative AraC family transcriptional regulator [Ilumatobacter coccineus YM16-304]